MGSFVLVGSVGLEVLGSTDEPIALADAAASEVW